MNSKTSELLYNIHNSFKNSEDETWNQEIQPQIESINEKYGDFFADELYAENEELNKKIQEAQTNYKKGFSHFGFAMLKIFGLFFSFILIVPFYWALKKYKQMRRRKVELQNILDEQINNKLEFLNDAAINLDLTDYFADMSKITKYENYGPLHDAIVSYIRDNSMFYLNNNENRNTLSTTWGVFDKNKIVVNVQEATHSMIQKEYSGSTTVQQGDNYITVTATIYKPYPVFNYSSSNWFFMSSCHNLEMDLAKTYPSANRSLFRNKKTPLENETFDKSFDWNYNDEVQFRMIFTPYTQEYYVQNAFVKKDFRENYNLTKIKSFISNEYYMNPKSLTGTVVDKINDYTTDIADLELAIRSVAIDKIHKSYLGLTPGWIIPILKSEDHTDALMQLKNKTKIPDLTTFHFILNKLFGIDLIRGDTDTFHNIQDSYQFMSSYGDTIYGVQMRGKSFIRENRVERVEKMTGLLSSVWVHVPYVHFEPIYAFKNIFMSYVNNKWTFHKAFSLIKNDRNQNLTDELDPIIQEYRQQGIDVVVEKDIVAVMCDSIPQEQITEIFDKIIPIVKKYN